MIEPTMRDSSRNTLGFHLALVAFGVIVFGANWDHSNQQQIFLTWYLPTSQAMLHGGLPYAATHIFYPMWGYPFTAALGLVCGHPTFVIELLQLVASLLSIVVAYRLLYLEKQCWHIPFLLPYFALCSVKWPDAFVAMLFLLHLAFAVSYIRGNHPPAPNQVGGRLLERRGRWIQLMLAGLTLGLIINFRTEYLLFPFAELLVAGIYFVRRKNKPLLIVAAVSALACSIGILPWFLYTGATASHPRLTTTNGASVAYISLGQLPGNPWHIRHLDSDAYLLAKKAGISDPYSEAGELALTRAFDEAVAAHPGAFVLKTGRNLGMAFVGGLYTGEYANLFLSDAQRVQLEQAHSFKGIPMGAIILFIAEKSLRILSIPVLLLLLFLFVRKRNALDGSWEGLHPLLLSLVLYRFATVALIQYEPRHINLIYAPLLFYALIVLQSRMPVEGKRAYSLKSFLR